MRAGTRAAFVERLRLLEEPLRRCAAQIYLGVSSRLVASVRGTVVAGSGAARRVGAGDSAGGLVRFEMDAVRNHKHDSGCERDR